MSFKTVLALKRSIVRELLTYPDASSADDCFRVRPKTQGAAGFSPRGASIRMHP